MKTCTKCGEAKALDAFGKETSKSDGLRSHCKRCVNESAQARKAADPDKYREIGRRSARKRRAEEPEHARDIQRRANARYRAAHRERLAQWQQDYAKTPAGKDMRSRLAGRRRARKRNAMHEPYSRTEIFALYGGTCAYCDAPAEHLDHVIALALGGADAAHNLLPACAPCNLTKSAKTLSEWALTFTAQPR